MGLMALMKMETKQCTKCKHFLLFECFRINKRTAKLTKRCLKCLDNEKISKENRKCEHNRLKEICCECKGRHHNKQRSVCRVCGGKQICPHNLQQSVCKKCGGGSIYQHQNVRSKCRSCHIGSFCEHEKVRYFCRSCDGSYVCKHLKQKIDMQMRSTWTPCWGCKALYLYCLEKRQRNELCRVPRMQYRDV